MTANPTRRSSARRAPAHWIARTATATAAALALVAGNAWFAAPAFAQAAPAALPAASGPLWGHELAGRPADPDVRFGRLPNGLRYAIQHNETPKDGVSMRLRIGSGSLQERDDEQGLAHFLEHMAFRGSKDVPDGEVVHMLQRQGLNFGPDTNAFTAQDQTVYHFNFPKADATALDTGFMLFREIGQHLTLAQALIDQEKGVVLSEERLRDVPGMRAAKAETELSLAGTRVVRRWPIGQVETIKAANAERLRRYYEANYRPDNATIVVVGNIDVDAVERQIRARFSDWHSAARPETVDLGTPAPTRRAAEFTGEGAPDLLSLEWTLPPDTRPQTVAVERDILVQQLAAAVLNVHLADRVLRPGSPFVAGVASIQPSVFKVAGQSRLIVVAPPEQWHAAVDEAVTVLRQLLAQGVQPADMQRVLPLVRSALQSQLAQAPTRQHAAIADALVNAANNDELYESAAQALAAGDAIIGSLKPEDLTAALRRSFGGATPLIFRSAKAGPAGADALSQALAQAFARPLAAQAAATAVDWPYTDFGAPGAIVSRSADAELGTTTVRFANGTRLVVKPTPQERDRINVQVLLGQGRSGLRPEQAHALWALGVFPLGGTGKRSLADIVQWQQSSGKQFGITIRAEAGSFTLAGDTRPADLAAQLQVLAAFARDPGFRPEMGEKLAGFGPMVTNQVEANAGAVFGREVSRVMNNGEGRLASTPTAADVAATQPADVPAMLRDALAGGADVVIVGDIGVDAAIAATQATFGAGPARTRAPAAPLKVVSPADGGPAHVVTHLGRADQAALGENWPMPDHWADPALAATGGVAAAIVQARLVDTVREQLGITYSPSASASSSLDVVGEGRFEVQIETPPEKFDTFRQLLRTQLHDLAAKPVSTDELQRAKAPMIERSRKAPEHNGHWAFWLPRILQDARMKAAMQGETADIEAVTAARVQAYFRDRLGERAPIEVIAKARDAK